MAASLGVLAAALSTREVRAYCREVTVAAPAGYDPSRQGCFNGPGPDGGPALSLFWRNQCTSYSLQRNASSQIALGDAQRVAAQAFSTWSAASCPNGGTPSILATAFPPVDCASPQHNNAIVFQDAEWPYTDSANAIGFTTLTVWQPTGEILGAEIEVNTAHFKIVASGSPPAGAYDLTTILTHEAGHFLGLAHSDDTSAVMYAFYRPDTDQLTPDDLAGICSIYSPDGTRDTQAGPLAATSCQPQPPLGFAEECSSGAADTGVEAIPCSDTLVACSLARWGRATRRDRVSPRLILLLVAAMGARRWLARRRLFVWSLVSCSLLGCYGGDDAVSPIPGAGGDASTADGARESAPSAEAAASTSFLRIANWSPDSPAVDVCVAPHATGQFVGPLVGALAASTESGPSGIAFPRASAYVTVPAGSYDARLVVGGAPDCTVGIGGDSTSLPAFASSGFATLAIVGEAHPTGGDAALQTVLFSDDASSSAAVALRFINASPGTPEADFGTGTLSSGGFIGIFQNVAFGTASAAEGADASGPSVDKNGYESLSKPLNATLSAHPSGGVTDSVSTSTAVFAASGSVLTITLVGGTSAGAPPALVECVDNAGTAGTLENCSTLP
jgi:hypothetical protein